MVKLFTYDLKPVIGVTLTVTSRSNIQNRSTHRRSYVTASIRFDATGKIISRIGTNQPFMDSSLDFHNTTEFIQKNLLCSMQPALKQLMSAGKAYLKALNVMSQQAKVYLDALSNVASIAKCSKGASIELAIAMGQIVEVQQQIQKHADDNARSFLLDFIVRLENKFEPDMKELTMIQREYQAHHKALLQPLQKSEAMVRKQQKKAKSKPFGIDIKEQKAQHEVSKHREKLDAFRQRSLRQALLRERNFYCFVLEALCHQTKNMQYYHITANDLLTGRQNKWSELYKNPNVLPEASEVLLAVPNASLSAVSSGEFSSQSDFDHRIYQTEFEAEKDDFENGSHSYTGSDYGGSSSGLPDPLPQSVGVATVGARSGFSSGQRVTALHTHSGASDAQLSFSDGDTIQVMGDRIEKGWQYGENTRTSKRGWFPVTFCRAAGSRPSSPTRNTSLNNSNKFRSMTDIRRDSEVGMGGGINRSVINAHKTAPRNSLALVGGTLPRPPSIGEIAQYSASLPRRSFDRQRGRLSHIGFTSTAHNGYAGVGDEAF